MLWNVRSLLCLILILGGQPVSGSVAGCDEIDLYVSSTGHHHMIMEVDPLLGEGADMHRHQQGQAMSDACCDSDCDCSSGSCSSAGLVPQPLLGLPVFPPSDYPYWHGAFDGHTVVDIFRPPIPA